MSEKIYAVKASKPGIRIGGWRVKALNMQGATRQALDHLKTLGGGFQVNISELKNQAQALKKWEADCMSRSRGDRK